MRIRYQLYLPPDFLNKEVNEAIIFHIMNLSQQYHTYRRGDPNRKEPDFIVDGQGLEVTFASFKYYSAATFINDFCDGIYSVQDARSNHTQFIFNALDRKAKKNYSVQPVSLAILCMLELFDWVDNCGILPTKLGKTEKTAALSAIKNDYLESGIFGNVYLLLPSLHREWFVYDVKNDIETRLSKFEMDVPYFQAVNLHGKEKKKHPFPDASNVHRP